LMDVVEMADTTGSRVAGLCAPNGDYLQVQVLSSIYRYKEASMSIVGFIFCMLVFIGIGMAIMGALVRFDDYDERKAKLLEKQYKELCASIEDIWPKPHGMADLRARHEGELAEQDK
jgi:hypothetical protein